ncbi:MAG TPA: hypothetical protein VGB50_08180 [Flavobacterium sp.]|jgi:hypothetical protein
MKKILILLLFTSVLSAQRFNILNGKPDNLKGISEYNMVFDYSGMTVLGFDSEEAFLKEKLEKRKEKEGKAEEFEKNWYEDRANKYEPKFIEYFNNRFEDGKIKATRNPSAKYTMTVKTVWIYPGYNVGVGDEPAKINAIITVSETANPQQVLLTMEFPKSVGLEQGQFDFDQGYRIAGAYEKLAKNMVMQIKRFN